MPEKNSALSDAVEILQLVNGLTPVGMAAVKAFISGIRGKSDEELKATGDAIDDQGIADANREISEHQPQMQAQDLPQVIIEEGQNK